MVAFRGGSGSASPKLGNLRTRVGAIGMLNLGMFLQPIHPSPRSQAEIYEEAADKIILADRLGFSEVWVGEHYSASTEPITSPLIFLATLIHRTKTIKLGCGTICLPNHHPAMVAGDIAMFDHLSGGRFLFGVGPGGLPRTMSCSGRKTSPTAARRPSRPTISSRSCGRRNRRSTFPANTGRSRWRRTSARRWVSDS